MSTPPANYGQPVSAPPGNWGQPPVSAPPNRSGGRVFVSGGVPVSPAPPVEPATRYDEYGRAMPRHDPYGEQVRQAEPVRQRPVQPNSQRRERPPGRGPFARFLLALLVVFLLVATPVVAGYVSYWLTAGFWPPPADAWFGPAGP